MSENVVSSKCEELRMILNDPDNLQKITSALLDGERVELRYMKDGFKVNRIMRRNITTK